MRRGFGARRRRHFRVGNGGVRIRTERRHGATGSRARIQWKEEAATGSRNRRQWALTRHSSHGTIRRARGTVYPMPARVRNALVQRGRARDGSPDARTVVTHLRSRRTHARYAARETLSRLRESLSRLLETLHCGRTILPRATFLGQFDHVECDLEWTV